MILGALDPKIEPVISALNEERCPRLFPMLTESFQKAHPADTWPAWCASIGKITDLEEVPGEQGWRSFRGVAPKAKIRVDVALDPQGRVSGLRATPEVASNAVSFE